MDPSCFGRGHRFLLRLVDLVHDGVKSAMAFDGILPPQSASFAGQAGISRPLACQSTPERLLHRFPSQGSQVPPPVGNPEWPARSVAAIRSGPTVPTPRAKGIREHRVPLCRRALEILKEARELGRGNPLVFPPVGGKPIANTATSDLLRESGIAAVPHGFRSSFRDSAAEETDHPREVIEAPVAHVVRNRVAIKGILWVMRTGLLWRGNNESLRANWGKMLQLGLGGSWRQLRGSVC